jgi:glycosyltransferase involved in cell wall biosynthesis
MKPMRILIDDEAFIVQRFGGVSRIFSELIRYFKKSADVQLDFYNFYTENEYLLQLKLTKHLSYFRNYHFPLKAKMVRAISRFFSHPGTKRIIRKEQVDLFHPSYYADYYIPALNLHKKVRLVFTVHDLIHELMPEAKGNKRLALMKRKNIIRADHIITVSQSTKKDLLTLYPSVDASRVTVIPLAQSLPEQALIVPGLPEKYILFVGERRGYKNFGLFLKAYARFCERYPGVHLVCTGSLSFSDAEKKQMEALSIPTQIIHRRCNDGELRYIYEQALLFVFPSLYEGFGIPVLEAFTCKTPVLLSNTSSLPEVAGEAALYFDPADENDLLEKLIQLATDENLRIRLIQQGTIRVKEFTWDKHIQSTLSVYRNLIQ